MPKIKTHKGAAKRFSLSSNGKIMRSKGMKSHLRRKKYNFIAASANINDMDEEAKKYPIVTKVEKEIRDYSAQKFFLMKQLEKE